MRDAQTPFSVCHVSAAQRHLDARTFHEQCVPLAQRGVKITLMAAHGMEGEHSSVRMVPLKAEGNRFLRMLIPLSIIRKALRVRADIYHLHDPELLFFGLLLKIVFRKTVIYDACEDYPAMMDIKAYIPAPLRSLAKRFVAGIESCGCRMLDGVVTADCGTMRRLGKIGGSRKLVFYNFPNLAFFQEISRSPKEFDLVYRGGFSDRTGMPVLLDALARLATSERPVRLLLIGYWDNPATLERLMQRISDLGLTDLVEVRGRINHETMCRELSRARLGICPLMPIEKFLRNIPVKVWEYWACGLPVVATDLPPIRPFFRGVGSGLLVEPGNSVALACAIRRILDNPTLAQSMSREGENAVRERFNNANEAQKLFCFYTKLLAGQA